jgi:hypothetical protein
VARDLFETYGRSAFEIRIVAKWIENYIFDEIIKRYTSDEKFKEAVNLLGKKPWQGGGL